MLHNLPFPSQTLVEKGKGEVRNVGVGQTTMAGGSVWLGENRWSII